MATEYRQRPGTGDHFDDEVYNDTFSFHFVVCNIGKANVFDGERRSVVNLNFRIDLHVSWRISTYTCVIRRVAVYMSCARNDSNQCVRKTIYYL